MVGFFRTVMVLIIVYYVLKYISKLLMPYFLRYMARKAGEKMQEKMGRQQQYYTENEQQEPGKVTIKTDPKRGNSSSTDAGEYVDFEEVD